MTTAPAPTTAVVSGRPARVRSGWKAGLVLVGVVVVTAWSAVVVQVDPAALVRNAGNATGTLVQLVQPDYSFIPRTVPALLQTLQMAVIATAVSVVLAVPLSFAASRATDPHGPVLRVVRTVMDVVRSIPDLLFASVFVTVVGTGALSGVLALVLFNTGILVKLVSEALDGVDRGGQEAALAAGATWLRANRSAMLPEVGPTVLSQTVYVLELNVRASTVIGLVGAGGLGMLIDQVRTFYQYHYLSTVILEVLVVVVLLELLSSSVRRRLLR